MRKTYIENKRDIFFAQLSAWLRCRGVQTKLISSLRRSIFLKCPKSLWSSRSQLVLATTDREVVGRGGKVSALLPTTVVGRVSPAAPWERGGGFLSAPLPSGACSSPSLGQEAPCLLCIFRKSLAAIHRVGKAFVKFAEARKNEKKTIHKFSAFALGGNFDFPIILVLWIFYIYGLGHFTRATKFVTGCG